MGEVIDPAAYRWTDQGWRGRPWHEAVLYVKGLTRQVADGALNFEALKGEGDATIREALLKNRGIGEWST